MKYFIGAILLISLSLTLSGGVAQEGLFTEEDPVFREIICEVGEEVTCVDNITFPAMHFETNLDR